MGNELEENFKRNFSDLLFETSLLAVYYGVYFSHFSNWLTVSYTYIRDFSHLHPSPFTTYISYWHLSSQ